MNKGEEKWWRVADGTIEGGSLTENVPHNTFLTSAKSYQNFELRLKMKITPVKGGVNSGVQIRSMRIPNHHEMSGYQADAGEQWWGKLYDESRRNKVIGEPRDAEAVAKAVKPTGWNDYRIRCEGRRIQTWLNGVAAVDSSRKTRRFRWTGTSDCRCTAAERSPCSSRTSRWWNCLPPKGRRAGRVSKRRRNEVTYSGWCNDLHVELSFPGRWRTSRAALRPSETSDIHPMVKGSL